MGQDERLNVDADDPAEVEYLHYQFPEYKHMEIIEAVKQFGLVRRNIEKYLSSSKRE